jgi:hypothetical protein
MPQTCSAHWVPLEAWTEEKGTECFQAQGHIHASGSPPLPSAALTPSLHLSALSPYQLLPNEFIFVVHTACARSMAGTKKVLCECLLKAKLLL